MAVSRRRIGASLGLVPFFAFVTIFLFIPTVIIAVNAVTVDGKFTTDPLGVIFTSTELKVTLRTLWLAFITAMIGGVVGALVAYAVSTASPNGVLRRVVNSASGVLAQFGGVALAFAFLATVGLQGVVTIYLQEHGDINLAGSGWLYGIKGLILVYSYFQIPLMVIVFIPALEGIRPQWREAAENLGATTWQFWRHIGFPLLFPAFLGSVLLLFANGMSAYATAKALVSQGAPITPLQISNAITSETVLGHQNSAFALALEMVVIVAITMVGYALLQRRASRWLR
jgi:putative spermidine/putrescine transport system permease protein